MVPARAGHADEKGKYWPPMLWRALGGDGGVRRSVAGSALVATHRKPTLHAFAGPGLLHAVASGGSADDQPLYPDGGCNEQSFR